MGFVGIVYRMVIVVSMGLAYHGASLQGLPGHLPPVQGGQGSGQGQAEGPFCHGFLTLRERLARLASALSWSGARRTGRVKPSFVIPSSVNGINQVPRFIFTLDKNTLGMLSEERSIVGRWFTGLVCPLFR
jgi:hypothetical protein